MNINKIAYLKSLKSLNLATGVLPLSGYSVTVPVWLQVSLSLSGYRCHCPCLATGVTVPVWLQVFCHCLATGVTVPVWQQVSLSLSGYRCHCPCLATGVLPVSGYRCSATVWLLLSLSLSGNRCHCPCLATGVLSLSGVCSCRPLRMKASLCVTQLCERVRESFPSTLTPPSNCCCQSWSVACLMTTGGSATPPCSSWETCFTRCLVSQVSTGLMGGGRRSPQGKWGVGRSPQGKWGVGRSPQSKWGVGRSPQGKWGGGEVSTGLMGVGGGLHRANGGGGRSPQG